MKAESEVGKDKKMKKLEDLLESKGVEETEKDRLLREFLNVSENINQNLITKQNEQVRKDTGSDRFLC